MIWLCILLEYFIYFAYLFWAMSQHVTLHLKLELFLLGHSSGGALGTVGMCTVSCPLGLPAISTGGICFLLLVPLPLSFVTTSSRHCCFFILLEYFLSRQNFNYDDIQFTKIFFYKLRFHIWETLSQSNVQILLCCYPSFPGWYTMSKGLWKGLSTSLVGFYQNSLREPKNVLVLFIEQWVNCYKQKCGWP